MPQLDPEVGMPAIKLVGPETSREETIRDLPRGCINYISCLVLLQGEPAVLEEVLAAVPDQLQRRDEAPQAQVQPSPGDSHPSRSRSPCQEWESSVDRSLARMHKAHQRVLSSATILEEEIERLSRMRAHSWLRVRSRSQDCWRSRGSGRKRGCHQVSWPTDPEMPSGDEESKGGDADLGKLLELVPTVASFLWGSWETSDNEGREMPARACCTGFCWMGPVEGGKVWHPQLVDWNYPQFQGKTTPKNSPGKLGHPLDCHGSYGN